MTDFPTSSKIKRLVVATLVGRVCIFFGSDPFSKNPFEAAAWYLHKRLKRTYKNSRVSVEAPQNISSSAALMSWLLGSAANSDDKIVELHIFSHAWSSGLSLNYGGSPTEQDLKDLEKIYGVLVRQHIGSDDVDKFNPLQLRISNFQYLSEDQIKKLRLRFADKAIVRLWGCNSGYTSGSGTGPYANIASTFAQYANTTGYGAPKGTSFYAFVDKRWTTEHPPVGNKAPWPFELRPYRHYRSAQSNEFRPALSIAQLVKKKLKAKTPSINYLDDNLKEIAPQPSDRNLYKIKSGVLIMVALMDFEDAQQKISLHRKNGTQVAFDTVMTISPHSEWKISSDKKAITLARGRNEFTGVVHDLATLTSNGYAGEEFYLKIIYSSTAGIKTYEGKQYRFLFY